MCNFVQRNSYIQYIDDTCGSLINSFNVLDVENRFKDKCFNPLQVLNANKVNNEYQYNECSYITRDRFVSTMPLKVVSDSNNSFL